MDKLVEEEITANEKPTPDNFEVFLPWACKELQIDANIVITKIQSLDKSNVVGTKSKKLQPVKSTNNEVIDSESIKSLGNDKQIISFPENTVKISAVYDNFGNLLQLKFDRNKKIPQQILKVIGLIIHFHKIMTNITINSGLDNACLYELNKLLALADITDVCLDNTALHDGIYDLILENKNKLKHLSMSRCKINDNTVKKIAINLRHPLPAAKTLLVLNLASNSITDAGAKYLAVALRTNRQLVYLNLADNKITDDGAEQIFDVLSVFLVTEEEMTSFRHRNEEYTKKRNCLMNQIALELKCSDYEKKYAKKKPIKPINVHVNTSSKKGFEKDNLRTDRSFLELEAAWLEKAKIIVNDRIGKFTDPFLKENVYADDGKIYCYGNLRLAYINISYNNVGYLTVKKILSVLTKQQSQNKTPKGLVNVSLEGNFIPSRCRELEQIDNILLSNAITARNIPKLRK